MISHKKIIGLILLLSSASYSFSMEQEQPKPTPQEQPINLEDEETEEARQKSIQEQRAKIQANVKKQTSAERVLMLNKYLYDQKVNPPAE